MLQKSGVARSRALLQTLTCTHELTRTHKHTQSNCTFRFFGLGVRPQQHVRVAWLRFLAAPLGLGRGLALSRACGPPTQPAHTAAHTP